MAASFLWNSTSLYTSAMDLLTNLIMQDFHHSFDFKYILLDASSGAELVYKKNLVCSGQLTSAVAGLRYRLGYRINIQPFLKRLYSSILQ